MEITILPQDLKITSQHGIQILEYSTTFDIQRTKINLATIFGITRLPKRVSSVIRSEKNSALLVAYPVQATMKS